VLPFLFCRNTRKLTAERRTCAVRSRSSSPHLFADRITPSPTPRPTSLPSLTTSPIHRLRSVRVGNLSSLSTVRETVLALRKAAKCVRPEEYALSSSSKDTQSTRPRNVRDLRSQERVEYPDGSLPPPSFARDADIARATYVEVASVHEGSERKQRSSLRCGM
jgi:hypothetical protein